MFVVQHGASIRYRRSIDAFVPFKVVTRLIFWDERSLYFEQSFVSLHDGFVRAGALCKNTVVGGSVVQMLASLGVEHEPEMPKEVELWLASQEITSSRLRSNKKETTSDEVPKQIAQENVEALYSSYLNNSDCISSTTSHQEEAPHHELNKVEGARYRLNHVGPSCSMEAEMSSTTSSTPSCQTEKLKDL
jgi:hypothetical protein